MDPTLIARIAHEADRTLAAVNGDMTVGGWPSIEAWQRHTAIAGVKMTIAIPNASAEALHEAWRRDKLDEGWQPGASLDRATKLDPMLVPWSALSPLQRRRELLFVSIVRSLSQSVSASHG